MPECIIDATTGSVGQPIVITCHTPGASTHPFQVNDWVYVHNCDGNQTANCDVADVPNWLVDWVSGDSTQIRLKSSSSSGASSGPDGYVNFCFPALDNNLQAQRPYTVSLDYLTIRNDMPTDYRYATYMRANPLHRWQLQYANLKMLEANRFREFFQRMKGRETDFGYLDPDKTYWVKCRFDQDALDVLYAGPQQVQMNINIVEIPT